MRIIGERIRYLLDKKSMEQKDLAIKLNLSPQTISGYITGYRVPNPEVLSRIADILDTTTDYLLGRTNEPEDKILNKEDLPIEWIKAGIESLVVFKDLSAKDLTLEDLQDILTSIEKVKKRHE